MPRATRSFQGLSAVGVPGEVHTASKKPSSGGRSSSGLKSQSVLTQEKHELLKKVLMTKENVFQVFLAVAVLPSHLFLTEEHQEVAVRYAY